MKTLRADGAQGECTLRHKTLQKERIIEDIENSEQKDEKNEMRTSVQVRRRMKEGSFTKGGGYACISK